MSHFTYRTTWFSSTIVNHDSVRKATPLDETKVELTRKSLATITVAPVATDCLDRKTVDAILSDGLATVIVLIPKAAHYLWEARTKAETRGSTIHTMNELYSSLSDEDPRPFVNKNVDYARKRFAQHTRVRSVEMICEASMRVARHDLSDVLIAVEYEYEFTEESLVRALGRHPGVQAVLNSNPNGRPTRAALDHAREAGCGLFSLRDLMGALNYDGDRFFNYTPPHETHR